MLAFNTHFYKNKKSEFYFEDRVVVLNDLFHGCGCPKIKIRSRSFIKIIEQMDSLDS
jgi:hypothetical protein